MQLLATERSVRIEFDSGILHKYLLITGRIYLTKQWCDFSITAMDCKEIVHFEICVYSSEFQVQKSVGQYKTWALHWTGLWSGLCTQ